MPRRTPLSGWRKSQFRHLWKAFLNGKVELTERIQCPVWHALRTEEIETPTSPLAELRTGRNSAFANSGTLSEGSLRC